MQKYDLDKTNKDTLLVKELLDNDPRVRLLARLTRDFGIPAALSITKERDNLRQSKEVTFDDFCALVSEAIGGVVLNAIINLSKDDAKSRAEFANAMLMEAAHTVYKALAEEEARRGMH